jgi:hypothetical protein
MHISVRRLIFLFFVLVFLVAAPLVVLYTAGYRLNISNQRLQQTGVLAITTFPRGSTIVLNGQGLAQRTPYVIQRIMPNVHDLTLQKKGYHAWQERIRVDEGRTSYVTARLFADSQPVVLNDTDSTLALRSRKDSDLLNADTASVTLFDNGANVEVRSGAEVDSPLIGLLPLGEYRLLEDDDAYVLLANERDRAFVIARQGGAVVELPTALTAYDWLANEDLLLWTDGTEVNVFEAVSGHKTFITREGQNIVDVAWHPEADSLFVATATTLTAYDRSVHEARATTTLLTDATLADIWLDTSGKSLYYLEASLPDPLIVTPVVRELLLVL